jgi:hypothetical protein
MTVVPGKSKVVGEPMGGARTLRDEDARRGHVASRRRIASVVDGASNGKELSIEHRKFKDTGDANWHTILG